MRIFYKITTLLVLTNLMVSCQKKNKDEDNPYEFGFVIDGEQHRHEKKDANGIIQGEFGFITADGVYHVTVYATDENGNFRILSMKNIRLADNPNAQLAGKTQAKQPSAGINQLSASTTPRPIYGSTSGILNQGFTTAPTKKPGCAGCGIPTVAPNKPFGVLPPLQNTIPSNIPSNKPNVGTVNNGYNGEGVSGINNPNSGGLINNEGNNYNPSGITNQNNPNTGGFVSNAPGGAYNPSGINGQNNPNTPAGNSYNPSGYNNQNNVGGPGGVNQYNGGLNNQNNGVNTGLNTPNYNNGGNDELNKYHQQVQQNINTLQTNINNIPNNQVQQNLNAPAPQINPLSNVNVVNNAIQVPGNNPIPIRDKFPGMTEGLPEGIQETDIKDLLYKFNYTVGFHGHYEKGLKNGAKVGGYFVNGRDGVSRIVTYVADENGYRPKVKFIRLGLDSDKTPKEETEKSFGLVSFEFVWYPIN